MPFACEWAEALNDGAAVMNQRDLRRAVRHGERELRAAGGDMLSQLNPRNILPRTRATWR